MTKKAFNEIWSGLAIVALYTTVNAVLKTQGSELYLSFPNLKDADKHASTIYGILVSAPMLFFLIRLSMVYQIHYGINVWSTKFPVFLNRQVDQKTRLGKQYQLISLVIFFIVPVLLQIHLLRIFFRGCLFHNKGENPTTCIADSFWEHLTAFQSWSLSWGNEFAYGSMTRVGKVTFFPGYQAWFFLTLEVVLYLYFGLFLKKLFRN